MGTALPEVFMRRKNISLRVADFRKIFKKLTLNYVDSSKAIFVTKHPALLYLCLIHHVVMSHLFPFLLFHCSFFSFISTFSLLVSFPQFFF